MSFSNRGLSNKHKIDGFQFGNVRVQSGEAMHIDGFVFGDIVVEAGAALKVDGFVIGNVINQGGQVHINGFVIGRRIQVAAKDNLRVINPPPAITKTTQPLSLSAKLVRLIVKK